MRNKIATTITILMISHSLMISVRAFRLNQSYLNVVNTSAELQAIDCIHRSNPTPPAENVLFNVDAPLSILPDGSGKLKTLWSSPWGAAWYSGTIENKNLFSSIISGTEKSSSQGIGGMWKGGVGTLGNGGIPAANFNRPYAWIMNLYQYSLADYLGFVHLEYESKTQVNSNEAPDRLYSIGLAYSRDAGVTWTFAGEIIRPHYDEIGDVDNHDNVGNYFSNIGGAPYIIRTEGGEKYFYVYYNEFTDNSHSQTNSVARAKFSDVLSDARLGMVTHPWKKLSSINPVEWNGAALPVAGTPSAPATPASTGATIISGGSNVKWWDMHADAAFCAPLNKFLLTTSGVDFTSGVGHRTLEMYASDDGVAWEKDRTIDEAIDDIPVPGHYDQFFYSSFFSDSPQSTPDSRTVGPYFNVLYMRQHGSLVDADLCTKKYSVDIGPSIRILTMQ